MRCVLDCSVVIKLFVPEADSHLAEQWFLREERGRVSFVAPDVLVAEFGHTLRKHVLRNAIHRADAHGAFTEFLRMRVSFFPSGPLAPRALDMALDHMGTFYDALYVALAEREDIMVLTADGRMTSAFANLDRTVSLAGFE